MANILNQTTDVLKVELTKHGRKMLGMGVFQPSFYSFFDDSVIYDVKYFNILDENQNEIQDRIMDGSLTISSLNLVDDILTEPLGTSDPFNNYAPAWDLNMLDGELNYKPDQSSYYKTKFSLSDIEYNILFSKKNLNNKISTSIETDYLLIDLQELNVPVDVDNFEVELIAYDEISGGKNGISNGKYDPLERKLFFHKRKNNVINDILYDDNELPTSYYEVEFNDEDASYYYDILVDEEIDLESLSYLIKKSTSGVGLDKNPRDPNAIEARRIQNTRLRNVTEEATPDPEQNVYRSTYSGPTGEEC